MVEFDLYTIITKLIFYWTLRKVSLEKRKSEDLPLKNTAIQGTVCRFQIANSNELDTFLSDCSK
jgi:hypothetical protein